MAWPNEYPDLLCTIRPQHYSNMTAGLPDGNPDPDDARPLNRSALGGQNTLQQPKPGGILGDRVD